MYIKQADLFWGMDKDFVKEAMERSEKLEFKEGAVIFRNSDPADHFFVLVKGRVLLILGQTGPSVYIARHAGEIIGWSGIIGRHAYSATARCTEPTRLLRFERNHFMKSLEKHTASEALLFRRLAEMLGHRLVEIYPSIS